MKKVLIFLLTFVCLFALAFELMGSDPDKKWSFRTYCEYVTTNIRPFPTLELSPEFDDSGTAWEKFSSFIEWLGGLIAYPFELIGCLFHNAFVLLDGFFPMSEDAFVGTSGGGGEFGDFAGGGHGGGGGGAR